MVRSWFRCRRPRVGLAPAPPARRPAACEPLEPRRLMSTVQVFAAGDTGFEHAQLLIDGVVVQTWEDVDRATDGGPAVTLTHETAGPVTADRVRVAFVNDVWDPDNGVDYNLRVDAIAIDGVRYETEADTTFSTGTWRRADGIVDGYGRGDTLHANGYFEYAATPPPANGPGLEATYYRDRFLNDVASVRGDAQIDFDFGAGGPSAAGVGVDNFGVRWRGQLTAPTSETYTLRVVADDGVRVRVGGELLIDEWTEHAATSFAADLALTAGRPVDLEVAYFENGGDAVVRLFWSSDSRPEEVIPASAFSRPAGPVTPPVTPPAEGSGTGLRGTYFRGRGFQQQVLQRIDAGVDFDFGDGGPDPAVGDNDFSVRWEGGLEPRVTGEHTLRVRADDGVRVWVGGELLIDEWADHAPTSYTARVGLTAGERVDLKVEYYENGGGAVAQLFWAGPGLAEEVIPASSLHAADVVTPPVPRPGTLGLTVENVTVDENAGTVNFVVFRAGGTDGRVTVDYATTPGTADAADFDATSGTLVFEDGMNGQQVAVRLNDDGRVEADETFTLSLRNPTGGATLGDIAAQTVTLRDNDRLTSHVLFEDSFEGTAVWTTDPFGNDTATTGRWAAGAPTETRSGDDILQPGSGHSGSRALITGLSGGTSVGTNDIDGGRTTAWSPVIALPAGRELELAFEYGLAYLDNATGDDYFRVGLHVGGGEADVDWLYTDHAHNTRQAHGWNLRELDISAYAGRDVRVVVQAADAADGSLVEASLDDVLLQVLPDMPGTISVATPGVSFEESAGDAVVRLQRRDGRVGEVSVRYVATPGTAGADDFAATSGTVTFADGQSEAFVRVPLVDDGLSEPLESFTVTLDRPTGGALVGDVDTAVVTIVDNDNRLRDFLPDLVPIGGTLTERLSIDTAEQPGRRLMRFSTEVANAGTGPLEIWGGDASGSSQEVFQRIYQENGQTRDVLAGAFVYHPGHGHIHFEAFATYDLRLVDASGAVIASGGKTSFCLINIRQPLPDVSAAAEVVHGRGGNTCGNIQGISAGYSDVYSASLDDQWIDVTDIADGTYWLEITADPTDRIRESDESNNVARVRVTLANGGVRGA